MIDYIEKKKILKHLVFLIWFHDITSLYKNVIDQPYVAVN